MQFIGIEIYYPEKSKGKCFRLRKDLSINNLAVTVKTGKTENVKLPVGSIGYCYSCNMGSVFLGFEAETKRIPIKRMDPTKFPIAIQLGSAIVFNYLDIEK